MLREFFSVQDILLLKTLTFSCLYTRVFKIIIECKFLPDQFVDRVKFASWDRFTGLRPLSRSFSPLRLRI